MLIKDIIFLIIGFILLIKGADFFVDGSSNVAKRLKVSPLIIGLTIVAMGTSLPELSVSVVASMEGNNALSISNAVGSNIFNLLVVLGLTSLFQKIDVEDAVIKRDFPISIGCAVLLLIPLVFQGELGRIWGIVFLVIFVVYLVFLIRSARKSPVQEPPSDDDKPGRPIWLYIIYIVGGIVAIKFGGDWVVDSAVNIAIFFGMTETLVGLTIVSVGTSLPELVTSIVAARKGQVEMAVGNVVGSNIFNILLILGTASAISPILVIRENIIDIIFLSLVSVIGYIFCRTRHRLSRIEGIVMLIIYAGFATYIILR